jgi:perosamine synthetase
MFSLAYYFLIISSLIPFYFFYKELKIKNINNFFFINQIIPIIIIVTCILIPNITFAATINAVLYVGATPVMVDVEPISMMIDINLARKFVTNKTKAIIPVHLYGCAVNMDDILSFAKQHKLLVIEDCAEALGTTFRGIHVGTFGDAAIFSFFGNKTVTTGEGGMLVLKKEKTLDEASILRDHGMSRSRRYWHDLVGYNYRLTNLQAAIGVAQMERVERFVLGKRQNAARYSKFFEKVEGMILPIQHQDTINSYWFYTIMIPSNLIEKRDEIMGYMVENGVDVRPVFFPLHKMPPYKKYILPGQIFPISNDVSSRGISLPSSYNMTDGEVNQVSNLLINAINNFKNSNFK